MEPHIPASDLPPDFELDHDYNIAYLVHIYDRNDVGTGMSVDIPVGQNYLDLDDEAVVLDSCEEYTFVMQALIGSRVSGNSTALNAVSKFSSYCNIPITCTVKQHAK